MEPMGRIQLCHGDCMDFMRTLPDGAFDLDFEFTGIEIDETYYSGAMERLQHHIATKHPALDLI